MKRTLLGGTSDDLSSLVLEAAEIALAGDPILERALRAMPRASKSTTASAAPPLIAMLRVLYGAVANNLDGPAVFAIGPLPRIDGQTEIRVDLCDIPAGESARSYAQSIAEMFPTVLAIGFDRMTGSGTRVHASGRSTPCIVSGLVASAYMLGDEDTSDLQSAWILPDGEESIEPCVPIAMAHAAEA